MKFKKTIIDWARFRTSWRLLLSSLKRDFTNDCLKPLLPFAGRTNSQRSSIGSVTPAAKKNAQRPIIFASYCAGPSLVGSNKYCGGEKVLNNLVLLLRQHGYEAFMVSLDGKHANWLVEHAPYISLSEFAERKTKASSFRCVTSWLKATAFLQHAERFYFWDQELGSSARSQFPEFARLVASGRILQSAGLNRVIQTWHSAVFGRETHLLRQILNERYWRPDPSRRIRHRVGFFDEGGHTAEYMSVIGDVTRRGGFDLEFYELQGLELDIIQQMQTCAVCLVLNIGKSEWGEGGPMAPWESMACGAVPVCFDLKGAWEIVQPNYSGVITEEIRPELMGTALLDIYRTPGRLEEMSRRCLETTAAAHTMEARWSAVKKFLDLDDSSEHA
jgi:Glycosyl transferases group 1